METPSDRDIILTEFKELKEVVVGLTQLLKPSQLEEERLLSPAETCTFFSPPISKMTLNNWSKQGLIPMHRLGGRVFYKRSDILSSLQTLKKYKHVRQENS